MSTSSFFEMLEGGSGADLAEQIRTVVSAAVLYVLARRMLGLLWDQPAPTVAASEATKQAAAAAASPLPPPLPILGWSLLAGRAMDLPPHLWQGADEARMFGRCEFVRSLGGAIWWVAAALLTVYSAGAALQYGCDMLLVATDEAEHAEMALEAIANAGEEEKEIKTAADRNDAAPLPTTAEEKKEAPAIGAANRNHLLPDIEDVVRHYHQYIGGSPTRRQMAWGFRSPRAEGVPDADTALIVSMGYPGESFWSWKYWTPSNGMCAVGVGLILGLTVYAYGLSSACEWSALAKFHLAQEHVRRRALLAPIAN